MSPVRVIALGASDASDDAAALRAVRAMDDRGAELIEAGRPGVGLLDLLEGATPVVLADVTVSGAVPGTVISVPLAALPEALEARPGLSSHGFGPAEAIKLMQALGRQLPPGQFVGIEGQRFTFGESLSLAAAGAFDGYVRSIEDAIRDCAMTVEEGESGCTNRA